MEQKRVVVTGLGVLSALGENLDEFWANIKEGKTGVSPITKFNTDLFKTKFACEIKNFDPKKHLERNEIKRTDLYTQYGLYVAAQAVIDSGVDFSSMDPFDSGVIWGSGQGGMSTLESELENFHNNDKNPRFNPFLIPKYLSNMASGLISMKFGLMGINYSTVSACASANTALMDAFNFIRLGKAKLFIAGGSEAPISEASIGGFGALKALSTDNENSTKASKPFDSNRGGFVMGEGAGAIILEEYEHAKARGAKIYAELVGASMTADAYHLTASHPEGLGATKAMLQAITEAGITPQQIDYLNAHATSTPKGDIAEINAIDSLLGRKESNVKISSTKSMTGHLLGAAAAIEAIVCIKAVQEDTIPATTNTENIDPEIPSRMNIVTEKSIQQKTTYALSNSFGFGGHNASVVFKKFE